MYDSIYKKYPEQTNPCRQKAEQWLPGAGGEGDENVPQPDTADG